MWRRDDDNSIKAIKRFSTINVVLVTVNKDSFNNLNNSQKFYLNLNLNLNSNLNLNFILKLNLNVFPHCYLAEH